LNQFGWNKLKLQCAEARGARHSCGLGVHALFALGCVFWRTDMCRREAYRWFVWDSTARVLQPRRVTKHRFVLSNFMHDGTAK
jgi:hypothetical protein